MTTALFRALFMLGFITLPLFAQFDLTSSRDNAIMALQSRLDSMLIHYELDTFDTQALRRDLADYGEIELELLGQRLVLLLRPNDLLSPGFRQTLTTENGVIERTRPAINTYHGIIYDDPESRVALQLNDDYITGLIQHEGESWYLRPAVSYLENQPSDIVVVYRSSDVLQPFKTGNGDPLAFEDHKLGALAEWAESFESSTLPLYSTDGYEVEIALEVDGLLWQQYENSPLDLTQTLMGRINELDLIWKYNLNLRVVLTFINSYTPAADPYIGVYAHGPESDGDFGDATGDLPCYDQRVDGLWEQFMDHWNASFGWVQRDVAVLLIGRDLTFCPTEKGGEALQLFGTAGGYGAVCKAPDRAYVVMEEYLLNPVGLLAHEIGHTLDAEHSGDTDCAPGPPVGPIMCPTVEAGSNMYTMSTRNRIGFHVEENHGCLEPIYPDMEVRQNGFSYTDGGIFLFPDTPQGTPITRTFEIRNNGPSALHLFTPDLIISGQYFQQLSIPEEWIFENETTTFQVQFEASNLGTYEGTLYLFNSDSTQSDYTITLRATATCSDTIDPVAHVTFPANGQTLPPGPFYITATASDNHAVSKVQFFANRVALPNNTVYAPPYSYLWNPQPGTHRIRVRAEDFCGNATVSPAVTVHIIE